MPCSDVKRETRDNKRAAFVKHIENEDERGPADIDSRGPRVFARRGGLHRQRGHLAEAL